MARKPSKQKSALTHIDVKGEARMVDVSAKPATERMAVAEGRVVMSKATLGLIISGNAKKGDVLGTARHRRHHGGEAHVGSDTALSSAGALESHAGNYSGRETARLHCACDGESHRPHRRRDGSAHGGVSGLPDDLRHGQGGRNAECGSKAYIWSRKRAASPDTIEVAFEVAQISLSCRYDRKARSEPRPSELVRRNTAAKGRPSPAQGPIAA